MSNINKTLYKGSDIALVALFLKGKQIQYSIGEGNTFQDMHKYSGEPDDVYRVSNKHYIFRVKQQDIITKAYMHYDGIEELVRSGDFNRKDIGHLLYDNNYAMNEHLEMTFVNGKLTNIAMSSSEDSV